ncbi:hypothetical protein GCM10009836_42510 [Pseudonocardia ailaonensis]|uniref:WYL domain-containing protein n=1 Tax=Pseudonocardia ailaonensis TaxID=367279 RepID=A0ABN2N9Y9_9PSEU
MPHRNAGWSPSAIAPRTATPANAPEPYVVVAHGGRWYVNGANSATGAGRTSRVDRIRSARLLPEGFPAPNLRDPRDRVLSVLATAPRRHTVRVLVHAERDRPSCSTAPRARTTARTRPPSRWNGRSCTCV